MNNNVLVVGYPFVSQSNINTFKNVPAGGTVSFLVPRVWKAKRGKVIYVPPKGNNILTARAFFFHSHYPLVGGLFKGIMPALPMVLWKYTRARNFKLLYSCSEPVLLTPLYYGIWAKLFGLKHVMFAWENIPYEKKYHGLNGVIKKLILRANLALCDGLICGNAQGAEIHRRYFKGPITELPQNGIDSELFRPNPQARLHSNLAGKIVFTYVGAIGFRKGIHLIIRALRTVLTEVPQAHLVIAGSGEYEAEIQRLIDEPLSREHITRFSWVDHHEMVRLLSISDVFVYPSIPYKGWAEQFGYSMAEASLMELPVISTRSGSIPEVVLDGATGILVPPDDADQLAVAMIQLGKVESLRKRLGTAGRQYIIARFSHDVVARKYYEFFNRILQRNA